MGVIRNFIQIRKNKKELEDIIDNGLIGQLNDLEEQTDGLTRTLNSMRRTGGFRPPHDDVYLRTTGVGTKSITDLLIRRAGVIDVYTVGFIGENVSYPSVHNIPNSGDVSLIIPLMMFAVGAGHTGVSSNFTVSNGDTEDTITFTFDPRHVFTAGNGEPAEYEFLVVDLN